MSFRILKFILRKLIKSKSILIKSDCFSDLGLNREEALWEVQRLRYQKKLSLFQNMFYIYQQ